MEHWVNPHVLEISPYKAGKPVEEIERQYGLKRVVKLASNENCLPLPEAVRQAVRDELDQAHLYPDSDNYYLRQAIAGYNRIPIDNVIAGAGSVELIKMIIETFLKPGETVLSSEKTFSLYKIATTQVAGKAAFIEAPMDEQLRFDLEQIQRRVNEKTKIVFLTNPNNPTGTIVSGKKIMDFIRRVPEDKIIVLDNAYQEYVDNLADYVIGIPLALERPNIIVLRTFSKIYSLASFRIGYAVSNLRIIEVLNRVKPPFNVTRLAQRAAIASLASDEFKNRSAELNRRNKPQLLAWLQELGLRVLPSQTNFLLFFPGVDVNRLNDLLLREGVIVRPVGSFGVPDGIRVTVGLEEENRFFIDKLKKSLVAMRP